MAITDASCIAAALAASHLIQRSPVGTDLILLLALAPAAWVIVFASFRLYSPHRLSAPEELRRIVSAASVGVVVVAIGSFWTVTFSRAWVGYTWLLALALELLTRRAWRWIRFRLRRSGSLALVTLIVGTNDEAGRIAAALRPPDLGFAVVGAVATAPHDGSLAGVPVLGDIGDLHRIVRRHRVECLFVASTALTGDEMRRVADAARSGGTELRVSANLPEILTSRVDIQSVNHLIAISLRPPRLTRGQAAVKRAVDLLAGAALAVLTLPASLLVAAAVKLTSPGPILFRQPRVTRGGRVFTMYKFRTMHRDATEILTRLGIDPTTPFFKLEDDPRLTPVGRFLRRFSLDELPQLINVLKGDMSLVGPRPLPVDQVRSNQDRLATRHEVRAGMTGWWQINGRSQVGPEEALRLDLFYLENWSLTLDLYILAKTAGAVLTGRGAH